MILQVIRDVVSPARVASAHERLRVRWTNARILQVIKKNQVFHRCFGGRFREDDGKGQRSVGRALRMCHPAILCCIVSA
jgi:hypothetical protein